MRSSPPACRSKVGPSSAIDITEHSMCHPGRPRPIGVSHDASPGFGAFQSAKSRALSFSYSSTSTRAPSSMPAKSYLESLPYCGNFAIRKRSEEHTSELQSPCNLVCRLLLEKKK